MSKKVKKRLKDKYISEKYKELLLLEIASKKLEKQEKKKNRVIKFIKAGLLFILALVCPFFYRELENLQKLKQIEIREFCIELNMGSLGFVKDSAGNYSFKYTHYNSSLDALDKAKKIVDRECN